MKILNQLSGNEIVVDDILALYTGPFPQLSTQRWHPEATFEKDLPDRICPHELVLHELNLLHDGYDFWAKLDDGRPEGPGWFPVRIER